jgi:hypothetical protein
LQEVRNFKLEQISRFEATHAVTATLVLHGHCPSKKNLWKAARGGRTYDHPVYLAETFIDPGRFRGTCYRAANWKRLCHTTGRGKASNSYKPNRPIKEVLGYELTPRFPSY